MVPAVWLPQQRGLSPDPPEASTLRRSLSVLELLVNLEASCGERPRYEPVDPRRTALILGTPFQDVLKLFFVFLFSLILFLQALIILLGL